MSFKVGIRLDDIESYHLSGDVLRGSVQLTVQKKVTLRGISLRTACDVDSSIEVNVAEPDKKPKLKVFATKMRLYEKEVDVWLDRHHYDEGEYDIPFEVELPATSTNLPPSTTSFIQPKVFGNINYTLRAHVKRLGTSWFSVNNDSKAYLPFLYMPRGTAPLSDAETREEPFNGVVPGSADPGKRGFVSSLLGRNSQPRPPLELKGVLSYPLPGISQGVPEKLGLRIQTGTPEEPVILKSVTLLLETVLVLSSKGNRVQQIIKSEPLCQEQLLRSGNYFKLDDVLAKAKELNSVIPTFDTPAISYLHQVNIELLLLRPPKTRSNEVLKFEQRVPVRILSPFASRQPLPPRPGRSPKVASNSGPVNRPADVPEKQTSERRSEKQSLQASTPTAGPSAGPSSSATLPGSTPPPAMPSTVQSNVPSSIPASIPASQPVRAEPVHAEPAHAEPDVPSENPPDYHEAMRE